MKKLLSIVLLFLIVTTCTNCNNLYSGETACQEYSQPVFSEEEQITTVYITATGSKYHKEDCRYLTYSKIKVSLKDAQEAYYIPCSVCNP